MISPPCPSPYRKFAARRVSSIVLVAACVTVGALHFARPLAAANPREVAHGSFEILDTQIRRVDSLLGQSFEISYPRYDAPEGMTFLVLRWKLKSTFESTPSGPTASIPDKQVFVETEAGKTAAIGRCDPDGTFHDLWAGLAAYENQDDFVVPFSAVFLVPRTAKQAKFRVAKLEVDATLEGEILPRLDWRDGLAIQVKNVALITEAKRQETTSDYQAGLEYALDYELQSPSKRMLAVTLRFSHDPPATDWGHLQFWTTATDLRLVREGQPASMPIGQANETGFGRLKEAVLFANDREIPEIETTLIYPVEGPMTKAPLVFRGVPLGEFDVEQATPAAE